MLLELRNSTQASLRYERKFHIRDVTPHGVECFTRVHPAIFREIYHQRRVNNIYFDTPTFSAYRDNVEGSQSRNKIRLRWYGERVDVMARPVLEIKLRDGVITGKESYPLGIDKVDSSIARRDIIRLLEDASIPEHILFHVKMRAPSLLNRYSRKYFLSADGAFRATIDSNMEYSLPPGNGTKTLPPVQYTNSCVLELKYEPCEDQRISEITRYLPYRATRHSKYVNGIEAVYPRVILP